MSLDAGIHLGINLSVIKRVAKAAKKTKSVSKKKYSAIL